MKKQKGTLTVVLNLTKESFKDFEETKIGKNFISELLLEAMNEQLKEKRRRIAKVKDPIKLSLEVKTSKL